MTIVKPIRTLPVSITGNYCSLQCNHCRGHFLQTMTPISLIDKKLYNNRHYRSLLISGGFNNEGVLPLNESIISEIKNLKNLGYKLNFHLGLIKEEELKKIDYLPDMVSFDLIMDDKVIKEVFHLRNKNSENFKESYILSINHFKVSPHILIGANYGRIEKEYETIDFLHKNKPEKLIFIIITPLENTPFKNILPPPVKEVENLWIYAKQKLPNTKFYLGCVRPKGKYRYDIDSLAKDLKFDAIVNPHPESISQESLNIFEECCALL